jgi:beta-galactosidase
MSLKTHKIKENSSQYILNDVETPIYSGTLHFFRTPPRTWNKRLQDIKEAHCNTVDTYVAWNWHEPQEGKFDFQGKTDPRRNLEAFLQIVEKNGLHAVVRPGPYICAEWRNGGIPDWLLRRHPEILSRNSLGKPLPLDIFYPPLTYLHPNYLAYVEKWYEKVCEVLRKHLYTNGGCIINVTLDDEPSYWETLTYPLMSDYNEFVVGSRRKPGVFQKWLKTEYDDLTLLNRKYHASYSSFNEVQPPRSMPKGYKEIPRFVDWHHFKLHIINTYVEKLYSLLLKKQIDVPVSLLDPYLLVQSWPSFQRFCLKRKLKIDLWTEFWPRSFYRSFDFKEDKMGEVAFKLGVYRSLVKKAGTPPVSIETQAFLSHHIEPNEAELLYLAILAYGINNVNYYLMVGGENPRGFGCHTGKTWDVSCPIALNGERRPHFDVIQRLGEFFKLHGVRLANTETLGDIAVGYYEPYEACSFPEVDSKLGFVERLQNLFQEYFMEDRGLLNLLLMSGATFDTVDLETVPIGNLLQYKQLWVYAFDFMDEGTQKKLVKYVASGGNLVVLPSSPYLNEYMEKTDIMKTLFPAKLLNNVKAEDTERLVPYLTVNAEGIEEMVVKDYIREFELTDETPIAWNSKTGKPCAYRRKFDKGNATLVGFKIQYLPSFHDFHRRFIKRLFSLDDVKMAVNSENTDLLVAERKGSDYSYIFVLNPTGLPVKSKISFTDSSDHKRKTIPKLLDGIELKRRGGLILAVNFPIGKARATVSYTTSIIQEIEEEAASFTLTLRGQEGTHGETAMDLPCKPKSILVVGGKKTMEEWVGAQKRVYVTYEHRAVPTKLKITL